VPRIHTTVVFLGQLLRICPTKVAVMATFAGILAGAGHALIKKELLTQRNLGRVMGLLAAADNGGSCDKRGVASLPTENLTLYAAQHAARRNCEYHGC
jgi:hypothetical protein